MTITELVENYKKNRDHYLSNKYNEAQLRMDFLDPFFELLGWDIKNSKGKPTNEREVLLEESLKAEASSNTKKPDYTFRLFYERKFFLEAKKPSVNIETDNEPSKQIRRYGFTAQLKISVLSNFENLAIYDCSQKIEENDTSSVSRIRIYHYSEYEKYFEEIKGLLGRESVYQGYFDETWAHIEEQLEKFSVNKLFLDQINDWRVVLGQEIFDHNTKIDITDLNDIVQRYINSVVFLRVCEDRDLEVYKSLLNFANKNDFKALIKKFDEADQKYNAGLFNHPYNKEIIENNSSAFWKIIKQLYFPESTYSFAVFASDILGNIYEVFIGQHLILNNGELSIQTKPEHIDRDIITTPTFIIQDILRHTALRACQGKSDKDILTTSFADIACGSGSFLLETYQFLNDYLIDYYLKNSPEILIQTAVNTYKLPFKIKRSLLENCIYGVDKDYNAVEACKFGLQLKLLEEENNSSITTPALPNLSDNIHFGNSLIESEMMDSEDYEDINPFNFQDMKFDVIVGNPPYMATEEIKSITPKELPLYKKNYQTAFKQFDKYYLFIERSLDLLKDNGYMGYIIPSKFAKVGAGKKLRALLKSEQVAKKIISFGANQVFHGKTTYTCLLILEKIKGDEVKYIEINSLSDWKIRKVKDSELDVINFSELEDDVWVLVPGELKPIYEKIKNQSQSLEGLVGSENIYNGIQTSANNVYIHEAVNEDPDFFHFSKDGKDWKIEKALTRPYYQTTRDQTTLNSYRPFTPNRFVIYPYEKKNNKIEFIKLPRLKSDFPEAYNYLNSYKKRLDGRDIQPNPATNNEWYRYGRHQCLDKCDVPAKIIVGVLSQGNKYAIDYYRTLISSGGTAGYCVITLPEDSNYSIYYIQALLDSKYLEWFAGLNGEIFRGAYIARGTKILKRLPIITIDFDNEKEKAMHDTIVSEQKKLINIQGKIDKYYGNKRKVIPLKRQFLTSKDRLDKQLKGLFGLGDDDNKVPMIGEMYAVN